MKPNITENSRRIFAPNMTDPTMSTQKSYDSSSTKVVNQNDAQEDESNQLKTIISNSPTEDLSLIVAMPAVAGNSVVPSKSDIEQRCTLELLKQGVEFLQTNERYKK